VQVQPPACHLSVCPSAWQPDCLVPCPVSDRQPSASAHRVLAGVSARRSLAAMPTEEHVLGLPCPSLPAGRAVNGRVCAGSLRGDAVAGRDGAAAVQRGLQGHDQGVRGTSSPILHVRVRPSVCLSACLSPLGGGGHALQIFFLSLMRSPAASCWRLSSRGPRFLVPVQGFGFRGPVLGILGSRHQHRRLSCACCNGQKPLSGVAQPELSLPYRHPVHPGLPSGPSRTLRHAWCAWHLSVCLRHSRAYLHLAGGGAVRRGVLRAHLPRGQPGGQRRDGQRAAGGADDVLGPACRPRARWPHVPFCLPNRTKCILLVSMMAGGQRHPQNPRP
jgi:hypothetical protein